MADATLNLELTTELEAVNTMLRAVGEAPISDLDEPKNISAINALKTLRRASRSVQAAGWWFNTEWDVTLAVSSGKIPLTDDILFVESWGRDRSKLITRRGGFVYNLSDNTDAFTGSLRVRLRRFLSFTDLPEAARDYITIKAARELAASDVGRQSGTEFGFTDRDEFEALVLLRQTEGPGGDHNVLTGNMDTFRTLDRGIGANSPVFQDFINS